MASNMCIQKKSAMEENSKMKTLANDLTRRLLNTSERLSMDERIKVVEDYIQKLFNSGYTLEQVRRIITNGIKGYEKKLTESRRTDGRKLHRTSTESSLTRRRKKLMGKTEWYRNKKNDDNVNEEGTAATKSTKSSYSGTRQTQRRLQNGVSTATDSEKPLKTRTVLFVEQTRDGRLAKDIREVLKRLEVILGFKVKVVERAGTSLKNLLPNTNPWAGAHCSRTECITCNQGAEELQNCTKRNLLYENVCLECNPEAWKKGELKTINKDIPSVYVGETARSVQERAKEHWEAFKRGIRIATSTSTG